MITHIDHLNRLISNSTEFKTTVDEYNRQLWILGRRMALGHPVEAETLEQLQERTDALSNWLKCADDDLILALGSLPKPGDVPQTEDPSL